MKTLRRDSPAEDLRASKPRMRKDIRAVPHLGSGGTAWMRLEDDCLSRFHRIGVPEYEFLLRLDGVTSIDDARQKAAAACRHRSSLSPEQAESILLWAANEGLIEGHRDTAKARDVKRGNSLMWIRLPLFTSEANWDALTRWFGWLFRRSGFIFWFAMLAMAMVSVLMEWERFARDIAGVLVPGSWLWFAGVWLLLKLAHEAGHLVCCRTYGGKVGEIGVAWMLLAPVAYVDLTDVYRIRSKSARIMTSLAGVYIEVLIASLAMIGWTQTNSPAIGHAWVCIAMTAGVSSIIFNLNPLMRLDGYHAVCDWLGRPHLANDGTQAAGHFLKWLVLGKKDTRTVPSTPLVLYGMSAFLYRMVVVVGLIAAAKSMYGRTGLVIVTVIVLSASLPRLWNSLQRLLAEISLRPAVLLRVAMGLTFICTAVALIRHLHREYVSGWSAVVEYADDSPIRCISEGKLIRVLAVEGQQVVAGMPLIEFENLELVAQLTGAEIELAAGTTHWKSLRESQKIAEAESQRQANEAIQERLVHLRSQVQGLILCAPRTGRLVAFELMNQVGRWFEEGDAMGYVADETKKKAIVAIPQGCVDELLGIQGEAVVFRGANGIRMGGTVTFVANQTMATAPHPAMAANAGGPLAQHHASESKATLLQPYLRLEATIDDAKNVLRPGLPLILVR